MRIVSWCLLKLNRSFKSCENCSGRLNVVRKWQGPLVEAEDDAGFPGLGSDDISLSLLKYNMESIEFLRGISSNPWRHALRKCEICLIIFEPYKLTIYLQNENSGWFDLVKLLEKCIYFRKICWRRRYISHFIFRIYDVSYVEQEKKKE